MRKTVFDLDFKLIRTDRPSQRDARKRTRAFELWQRTWAETFKELGVDRRLNSDDFLHRELGGLFAGDKPIGFMLFHFLDLSDVVWLESAYFNNYPPEIKALHTERPEKVMVISYMTLEPEWRKSETDLPVSELLTSFAVLRFLSSDAKRLIGYFRNNRRTNEMFYRHGGQPLLKGTSAYNVEVDFAEISRDQAQLSSLAGCGEAALELWNRNKHRPLSGEINGSSENERAYEAFDGPSRRKGERLRLG